MPLFPFVRQVFTSSEAERFIPAVGRMRFAAPAFLKVLKAQPGADRF